jgi:putative selenate reductase FAD-binding subunit
MITIKEYKKVESLEEAWKLNQKKSNCVIGGMLWTKMRKSNVQTAIDLSGLGLDKIEEDEDEFRIGCMVTLRQLETCEGLALYTQGAMKESVRHIVGVQFRNLATVGGSIYGRYGFSDVLTMFLVMDTYVELYKGGIIPLSEFADKGCNKDHNKDILVRLIVKKADRVYNYQSVRNSATDFPVLTCAVSKEAGNLYQFAVGARPERAMLIQDERNILKDGITEEKIKEFAKYAREITPTGKNMRGSAEYRSYLVEVLMERGIRKVELV